MNSQHKEKTAHIRKRLKACGIPARCRKYTACGIDYIQVFSVEHGKKWLPSQIREIALIAKVNRLTGAQGAAIDIDHYGELTGKEVFNFEYHSSLDAIAAETA